MILGTSLQGTVTQIALLASVVSLCTADSTPQEAVCTDYSITVRATADLSTFAGPKWTDNNELTQFIIDVNGRIPNLPSPFNGDQNVTSDYKIGATFCTPRDAHAKNAKTVLLATHGLGFDRSYWNLPYDPDEYNFVDFATQKGYSVFFYDRLGLGESSSISGFVNQYSVQLAILEQLASYLRAGQYTGSVGVPDSIVLLGHSFGSYLSHALVAYKPDAVDALILTGYGLNASALRFDLVFEAWQFRIASGQDEAFAKFDAGYTTWVDLYANINTFFKGPYFSLDVAKFAESKKQPIAFTEPLTINPGALPLPKFKGPVLLITGEYDFIFCNGYCTDVLDSPADLIFGASKKFKSYVQPNMGHGMNLHKNATGYFGVVTDFLGANGL